MQEVIDPPATTGERIKQLRISRGLSQQQVADGAGVSDAAVSRWETGTLLPGYESLIALSTFFGVSADYLLGLDRRKR